MEIAFTAHEILERISSKRVCEMALRWNLQGQLDQMQQHLKSAMQETFHDQNQGVELLRDALSEADKIFDELEVHALQSQIQPLQRLKLSKVKNFFCSLNYQRSNTLQSQIRVQIGSRIRSLNSRLAELQIYWTPNLRLLGLSNQHERVLMHRPYPVQRIDVFGRENDREKIVEALLGLRNESAISVVPVFGIGGIGKTTLAKMVYNDARVMRQFQLRIWVNASRVFDVNKLVEKVIKSASGNEVTDLRNLNEAELRAVFCKVLLKRTYLLVLDDLWIDNEGQWNELKSLLAGGHGNMILVTTRSESVASITGTVPPYNLGGILDDDCLALFLRKASGEGEEIQTNPNLLRIGAEITKKCEGIPLDAVVLGSSLYKETSLCHWEWIRDHRIWDSGNNAISTLSALKISYEKLPCYLKVCLAYSSVFLDSNIQIDKLIQLWMAQGLIHPSTGFHEPEEIGLQYFEELRSRSFFQEMEGTHPLFISVCKMHDLVHYIAEAVVDGECSTIVSHSQNISKYVRHIALSDYDLSGKELPSSLSEHSMLRTIFFPVQGVGPTSTSFVEACISRFKYLLLLDLSDSCFEVLPNSIEELKHLKYLDVSANGYISSLPNAVCKLQSLQTLRVAYCTKLEVLPSYTENMINLRHLYMTTRQEVFSDKIIGCLRALRSLYIYSCKNLISLSDGLQHLTSLRTLTIVDCPRLTFLPSSMKYLTALKSLSIIDCEELTLLEWQDIEGIKMLRSLVIGGLPQLESKDVQCLRSLQLLVVSGLPHFISLPRWLEGAACTLRHLRVDRCPNFMSFPEWLRDLTSLESIEVSECRKLSSLPEGMHGLTNLKVLTIDSCPKLSEACQSMDKSKIDHIPKIIIDRVFIR
ncbi:disease resistance protein RGA2-like [Lycium ferocissimum]|uniref:disease resistance protein RGA2-like n=1 Tax=Lycium ferocissimum TaxID=112874 RepID=UPI0028159E38|nr:disease resistance protein RGA2-like [Lycium ferocissimum]